MLCCLCLVFWIGRVALTCHVERSETSLALSCGAVEEMIRDSSRRSE
jgi:hypothetical protein